MPLSDTLLRAYFRLLIKVVLEGIEQEFLNLWNDTLNAFERFIGAFPNIPLMVDIAYRWATSLVGRLLTSPLTGMEAIVITYLTKARLQNKLMRVDDAVRMMFEGPRSFIRFITLTDETGVIEALARSFALWVYHTFKRVKLLSILIRGSAEEFAQALVRGWISKATRLIWVALFVAIFVFLAVECAWLSALLFGFGFLSGRTQELILPQDSKRAWRKRGGVARVNARRGRDEPET